MNLRPSGYEPDELPDCSIPRCLLDNSYYNTYFIFCQIILFAHFRPFLTHSMDFSDSAILILSIFLRMIRSAQTVKPRTATTEYR